MKTITRNPCQWRLATLLSLETEEVHELACWAVGTLTSFRLVLGRCLLALHESKGYKSFGCSSATHYGASVLGVTKRFARECKRVAGQLQNLPALTLVTERGEISWSKVREIGRVASPHTEDYWLELAADYSAERLRKLAKVTPVGQIPGAVDMDDTCTTEFRIAASPQLIQLFQKARRMFSLEQDKTLTGAETLERLIAGYLSVQPLDSVVLDEVRREADKDLQAERARQLPEVIEARRKAAEFGLLDESAPGEVKEDEESVGGDSVDCEAKCDAVNELLNQAVGTDSAFAACQGSCCSSKRPSSDTLDLSEMELLQQLTEALNSWKNKRLRFNPLSRHATKAQREEICRRDGWQCSTPGCPNRSWLHLHHIKPYSQGGATTPRNLICLCSGCHRNLHDGFLKITPTATGKLLFTDQEGRRLDHQANIEIAAWLDYWHGWKGTRHDSHQLRAANGEWAIF